ncbi:MAG: hypothetical protein V3U43_02955 [Pseudomonadales bacterium]
MSEEYVIDDTRFRVVFLNELKKGASIVSVRRKIAQRFNLTEEAAERMLTGRPIVVKKDVGAETAFEYKLAIDETGANCKIEVMPKVDDTDVHGYIERRKGERRTAGDRRARTRGESFSPDRRENERRG